MDFSFLASRFFLFALASQRKLRLFDSLRARYVCFACARFPWQNFDVCAGDFRIYRRFARMRGKYRRGEAAKNCYSLYWRGLFIFGRRFVSKGRELLLLLRPKIRLPICLFRRVDFNGDFIRLLFRLQLLASFIAFKRFQRRRFSTRSSRVGKSRERRRTKSVRKLRVRRTWKISAYRATEKTIPTPNAFRPGAFGGFLAVFFRKIAFAAWNFGANPL